MGDFRLGLGFWKPLRGILPKARFDYQKSVFLIFFETAQAEDDLLNRFG